MPPVHDIDDRCRILVPSFRLESNDFCKNLARRTETPLFQCKGSAEATVRDKDPETARAQAAFDGMAGGLKITPIPLVVFRFCNMTSSIFPESAAGGRNDSIAMSSADRF